MNRLLATLCVLAFINACGKDEPDESYEEALLAGQQLLADGDFSAASERFSAAAADPASPPELRFGYALSDSMAALEGLANLGLDIREGPEGGLVTGAEDEVLAAVARLEAAVALLDEVIAGDDFQFQVDDGIPVRFGGVVTARLLGGFDRSDAYFAAAMQRSFIGLFYFALAHDFADVETWSQELDAIPPGDLRALAEASNARLLASPTLFDLKPDVGLQRMQAAQDAWVKGFGNIRDGVEAARFETDDQRYEFMTVSQGITHPEIVRMHAMVREAGSDELTRTKLPLFTSATLTAMERMTTSLTTPGERVGFRSDLIEIGATLAIIFIDLGFVRESLDFDVPVTRADLSADFLIPLIMQVVPDAFEFDFGTYFQHPVGVRAFFPKPGEGGFRYEWECPSALGDDGWPLTGFACPPEAELVDSAHYVGDLALEFGRDYIPSIDPYTIYSDPTYGGMLYIDLSRMDVDELNDEPAGFVLGNQRSLNAVMITIGPGTRDAFEEDGTEADQDPE